MFELMSVGREEVGVDGSEEREVVLSRVVVFLFGLVGGWREVGEGERNEGVSESFEGREEGTKTDIKTFKIA